MKLKTKITAITAAFIFLSLALSNILILFLAKDAMIGDAVTNAGYEAANLVGGFQTYCNDIGHADRQAVQYYLKELNNDYVVCVFANGDRVEEYFNKTIYSPQEIRAAESAHARNGDHGYLHTFSVDPKNHIIAFAGKELQGMTVYYLVDLRDAYEKVLWLTAASVLSSVVIFAVSLVLLYQSLRHSLAPLAYLSGKANSIAGGNYSARIDITSKDEIAALSGDFNKMAAAVEAHNNQMEAEAQKRLLFMGNLTHELKTPLTAIQGYSETLLTAKLSEEDKITALSYINSECKRLSRLSKKMMHILELENGEAVQLCPVALNTVFSAVRNACSASAAKKHVVLSVTPTDMVLDTDLDLMTDVLVNLCDNAIKASDENGIVRLYVQDGCIVTEDCGCGIPPAEIEKIMQPFYRVDPSRSRKNGGSGLGLYLTSLIIRTLGMELRVESKVGAGTKITIYNSFNS